MILTSAGSTQTQLISYVIGIAMSTSCCPSPKTLEAGISFPFFVYNQSETGQVEYHELGRERTDYMENGAYYELTKCLNLDKISKMAAFQPDWNGTGGLAFTDSAINLFRNIIEHIDKQPQIAPTGRNSLLLQYELADKSMLAFDVKENSVDSVYVPQGDFDAAQCETYKDDFIPKIAERVERFYERESN